MRAKCFDFKLLNDNDNVSVMDRGRMVTDCRTQSYMLRFTIKFFHVT